MGFEQIGLQAVFQDENFRAGIARYQQGVSRASHVTDAGASAMSKLGAVASGALVVGIGAGIAALGAFAAAAKIGLDAALARGEELDQLGDMFGLNAKQADVWATAMSHFKVPVAEGAQQLNFFTRGLAETVKVGADGKKTLTPFGEALDKLGVKAFDARGKLRTFDQVMPQIMDRFAKLPDGIEKSRLAMELFGTRGGSKFLDFLSAGSKALGDATKRVDQFGGMTDEQVSALEEFGFALGDVQDNLKKIWSQVGLAVLPVLRRFVDFINVRVLPVLGKWVKDNMPKVTKALEDFSRVIDRDVLPFVQRLVDVFKRLESAFQRGGLAGVFSQIVTEIQSAIPMILATLQGLGSQFWNWLTGKGGALEQAGTKLGQISTKIQDWIKANGPTIVKAFETWKTDFWNWLTGKGGALEKAGEELGKIKTKIEDWIKTNAPAWGKQFESWKTDFWNWLTDKKTGVISQLSTKFKEFADNFAQWVTDNKQEMKDTGVAIGKAIVQAIATLFKTPGEADDAVTAMGEGLDASAKKTTDAFLGAGKTIAEGLIDGIIKGIQETNLKKRVMLAIATALFGSPAQGTGLFTVPAKKSGEAIGLEWQEGFESVYPDLAKSGEDAGVLVIKNAETGALEEAPNAIDSLQYPFRRFIDWLNNTFSTQMKQSGFSVGAGGSGAIASGFAVNALRLYNAVAGSMGNAIASGGASTYGTAYNTGLNVGVTFGNGIVAGIGRASVGINQAVTNALSNVPDTTYHGLGGFANGGPVLRTGLALVHAGEYVIPAPQVNNSRVTNLQFNHTWPATVPSSARAWTESMVRQVTQQEIKRVMGAV